jgi:molybdopterin-guanine dinucleotide biosynthesis protein A
MTGPVGLLLLTGGKGSRLGGTKHDRDHPRGGSWGGHLVKLHRQVFGDGPVCILGAPLPDFPELPLVTDPGEGPAVALRAWAAADGVPDAARWWVVACDQVRWNETDLRAWHAQALIADPTGRSWVIAESAGRLQPLGGFLSHALRATVAASTATSMRALLEAVPSTVVPSGLAAWEDIDTEQALKAWQA